MGRPPINKRAMTAAERQQRYRAKTRGKTIKRSQIADVLFACDIVKRNKGGGHDVTKIIRAAIKAGRLEELDDGLYQIVEPETPARAPRAMNKKRARSPSSRGMRTDEEVWAHPRAQGFFNTLNQNRKLYGYEPMTRKSATHHVRDKLEEYERDHAWSKRQGSESK